MIENKGEKMDYKEEFLKIYKENIKREGADKLLEWLEKSDFFCAPASTRFHSCHEGGLCEHSVKVYNRFLSIYSNIKSKSSSDKFSRLDFFSSCSS